MRKHIESAEIIAQTNPNGNKRVTVSNRSIAESFWSKVVILDACWKWIGQTNGVGYGKIERGNNPKKIFLAHRVSWQIHFGDIPGKLHVLHKCDNPPCCNPSHLFLGTNSDNHRDKIIKGRQAKGDKFPHTILSITDVRLIRELYSNGITQQQLAKEYGLCQAGNISLIVNRKSWKHVTI